MKALIVDDSSDIRSLMRVILEHAGHTVVGEAENGVKAVAAFRELRPDVVFLDIIMPGKSGVEVLDEIRALDPAAQVVMVTAVEQDRVNRQLVLNGAAGIIFKPFSHEDFTRSLHGLRPAEIPEKEKNATLTRLAAGGLSKCMLKASDASTWKWELCGVTVSAGRLADAAPLTDYGRGAASVQVYVRGGASFPAAMIFRSEDLGFIAGCFVSGPLYRTEGVKELEEGMVMEIGNIILNSLANPLINALKKSAIPSVPILVKGGPAAITAALGACLGDDQELRVVSATLAMRRAGRTARAGVVALLPGHLAAELASHGVESA